jgi:hypothetical protein
MSRRNDEATQLWPISRSSTPPTISTPGTFSPGEVGLSCSQLSDTVDASQRQCTQTSYASACMEEMRRGRCYRTMAGPHWSQCSTTLDGGGSRYTSVCFFVNSLGLGTLLFDSSLQPDVTPEFRQETQRNILLRRYAIDDLAWSLRYPYSRGASALVLQHSIWSGHVQMKAH